MRRPRLRDVLLVATAAVITSGLSAFAATGPDDQTEPVAAVASEDPSETPSEFVAPEPSENAPEPEPTDEVEPPEAPAPKPPKADKPKAQRQAREPGPPAGKPARGEGKSRGKGHGAAVSAAARGESPPVGDCRNHGHWVSSVAQGHASCDDNPRPAAGGPSERGQGRGPDRD